MTLFRLTARLALVLLASVLLASAVTACGGSGRKGTGHGEVVAVDAGRGEITLDHGEIPGMMDAMTMSFPVADRKLLEGVAAGQKVEFDLEFSGGKHTVTAIRPEGG
jgi:Cu/Ag efflux protein CusF